MSDHNQHKAQIKPGLYQHYKGPLYRVVGVTTHSESQQKLVLYQALYGEKSLWSRPLEMFLERVATAEDSKTVPRFAYLENQTMVLEIAKLSIQPGQTDAFLRAFDRAAPLLERQPGYIDHQLRASSENSSQGLDQDSAHYLLEVVWQSIDDHRLGFRQSNDYEQWRTLLHHFYEPFPTVEYYEF